MEILFRLPDQQVFVNSVTLSFIILKINRQTDSSYKKDPVEIGLTLIC